MVLPFGAINQGKTPRQQRKPDMLVVASHQKDSLSSCMQQWLKGKLSKASKRPQALVALVEMGDTRQPTPLYQELRELAETAGATFFHRPLETSTSVNAGSQDALLKDRWGLNE